jgi:spermidine/putrescine-binding protein
MFAPKDAPNLRLAEAFMDYILDPKVNADIVEFTTYATPNQAAIDSGFIDEALLNNAAVFPTAAMMTNMFFTEDVADSEQLYNDAWDELVIQVGS